MNKQELIGQIAEKSGLPKTQAEAALTATLDSITDALSKEENVAIVGFGTFSVQQRAARLARNPRTGEEIQVSASKAPKFKAGKGLKDAVK